MKRFGAIFFVSTLVIVLLCVLLAMPGKSQQLSSGDANNIKLGAGAMSALYSAMANVAGAIELLQSQVAALQLQSLHWETGTCTLVAASASCAVTFKGPYVTKPNCSATAQAKPVDLAVILAATGPWAGATIQSGLVGDTQAVGYSCRN